MTVALMKRGNLDIETHPEGRWWEDTERKMASISHRTEASGETNSANTLIWGFSTSEIRDHKFLLCEPPSL